MAVVLPAPLGPMTPTMVPGWISRSTPSSATTSSNRRPAPRSAATGPAVSAGRAWVRSSIVAGATATACSVDTGAVSKAHHCRSHAATCAGRCGSMSAPGFWRAASLLRRAAPGPATIGRWSEARRSRAGSMAGISHAVTSGRDRRCRSRRCRRLRCRSCRSPGHLHLHRQRDGAGRALRVHHFEPVPLLAPVVDDAVVVAVDAERDRIRAVEQGTEEMSKTTSPCALNRAGSARRASRCSRRRDGDRRRGRTPRSRTRCRRRARRTRR